MTSMVRELVHKSFLCHGQNYDFWGFGLTKNSVMDALRRWIVLLRFWLNLVKNRIQNGHRKPKYVKIGIYKN
ncbi:hypothetical protein Sjap_013293 [Stephania japonica]|uniref:Uncharacterized protein n=1 Tax=Stephania japonica TaxID=461633 RepID=A0AAP0J045_9MAGN